MVSSVKLSANLKVLAYDFDPNESAVTDIGWVDLSDYETFMAIFIRTIGTGALDTYNIIANYVNDTGTDVTVKSHAIASEPDALMDKIILECTAAEVAALQSSVSQTTNQVGAYPGNLLRYVTVEAELATTTDEGVVVYILGNPRFPQSGLTADSIA